MLSTAKSHYSVSRGSRFIISQNKNKNKKKTVEFGYIDVEGIIEFNSISNITFFIGHINTVIKLPIYFNSHMRCRSVYDIYGNNVTGVKSGYKLWLRELFINYP